MKNQNKQNLQIFFLILILIVLPACNFNEQSQSQNTEVIKTNEELQAELTGLKGEAVQLKERLAKLEVENAELKVTPSELLNKIDNSIKASDVSKSEETLQILKRKHPTSKEVVIGSKLVEGVIAQKQKEELEQKKIVALGFKGLKISPNFSHNDTTLKLSSAKIGKTWEFDAYGDSWMYAESEKGDKYVSAKLTIESKSKDPLLFGIGLYTSDGEVLNQVGNFKYKFKRWDDYGSYLGNDADFRNDFAHSSSIPFTIGVSVSDEILNRPIYLVVTNEGCHERQNVRFNNPPVIYQFNSCKSLKMSLKVEDFKNGSIAVLKRIN